MPDPLDFFVAAIADGEHWHVAIDLSSHPEEPLEVDGETFTVRAIPAGTVRSLALALLEASSVAMYGAVVERQVRAANCGAVVVRGPGIEL